MKELRRVGIGETTADNTISVNENLLQHPGIIAFEWKRAAAVLNVRKIMIFLKRCPPIHV